MLLHSDKKIVESKYKLFKGLRLIIDKKYNKYKFEYENRSIKPCINYKMILTHNDLQLMIDKFIDLLNDKYKDNNNFNKMDYYKLEKPVLLDFSNVNNEIIDNILVNNNSNDDNNILSPTQFTQPKYTIKPDIPNNFSLYKEKESWYLSYSKNINNTRYNKKQSMQCMCIQTELDKLINEINKEFPNLNIEKYIVKNPHDFIDNTQIKDNNKPIMPKNFSICNINGIDYIQFCKKINEKKISLKTKINSYDLQNELDNYINYLNKKYDYKLENHIIEKLNNWKTNNTIK